MAGGTPVIKKFRVASGSTANAGGYVTQTAAGGSGVVLGLTTTITAQVGSTLDAATGSTTPTSDSTAITSVIINPLAVYRMLVVEGATGGACDYGAEQTGASKVTHAFASSGAGAINSVDYDEGTIVCISGANRGQVRKITSTDTAAVTITEGWVNNHAAGDTFLVVPWGLMDVAGDNINLTTNLANARMDIAVGTGADFKVIELQVDVSSLEAARNQSYVFASLAEAVLLEN
jgi:hypothetical protein